MRILERRVAEAGGTKAFEERTHPAASVTWASPDTIELRVTLRAESWALMQRAMEGARRSAEGDALLGNADALAADLRSSCGCAAPRQASEGKPLFDDTKVRPPANEPYFCFSVVDSEGDERSQCEVIKEWCVREIDKSKAAGRTVTSGCRAVDAVSCYVGYATGGMISNAQSFCWETPHHCEAMSARSVAALGNDNVSACKSLDKTFQPAN